MRSALILLAAMALMTTGCLESSAGTVSGTVMGSTFDVISGSAEREGGGYTITLSDAAEFSCTSESALPDAYLTIVVTDVSDEQEYNADGTVSFNSSVDNVGEGEAADAGTLTITSIDDTMGRIEGTIDASGPNSAVEGDFKVDICN